MFTSFRVKLLASLAALVSTLASLACWLWEQCSCALPEAAYSLISSDSFTTSLSWERLWSAGGRCSRMEAILETRVADVSEVELSRGRMTFRMAATACEDPSNPLHCFVSALHVASGSQSMGMLCAVLKQAWHCTSEKHHASEWKRWPSLYVHCALPALITTPEVVVLTYTLSSDMSQSSSWCLDRCCSFSAIWLTHSTRAHSGMDFMYLSSSSLIDTLVLVSGRARALSSTLWVCQKPNGVFSVWLASMMARECS
mmetsp:Transcript_44796/g.115981  ORF Transcript_44796/g.115981 Transcript_44796/m.115981 type:complete len:256 (+) Transcript_44796:249-1016(+)